MPWMGLGLQWLSVRIGRSLSWNREGEKVDCLYICSQE
jgi:hypothetical protein